VRITPFTDDVRALAAAGAAVIAVDATGRRRPETVADLLATIRATGRLAMADLSSIEEARAALALGFDIVGTTLSGYTGGNVPLEPDLGLVSACKTLGAFVVAEGRYNDPRVAAEAILAGADAVCVGSAITRTEHVTSWFRQAVDRAVRQRTAPVLAFDIGGTKTLAALVRNGAMIDRRVVPTSSAAIASPAWFDNLAAIADGFETTPTHIAAAVTGNVDNGIWSPLNRDTMSLPEATPIIAELERCFNRPASACNDAQAAAWGEYRFGAGRGMDMVFVTISSGIGGGIVLDGRLLRGRGGLGGSIGQQRGAPAGERLETHASGFAVAAAAERLGHAVDARGVLEAADAGAAWATKIVDRAVDLAVDALADLQLIVDPDCFVIGGGLGLATAFHNRLQQRLARFESRLRPHIVRAQLGADAGALGVADLALEQR
jgi:N-acetylmannosamine-6-phosphate 2-epimerase/N-acetylmannosamine kinase